MVTKNDLIRIKDMKVLQFILVTTIILTVYELRAQVRLETGVPSLVQNDWRTNRSGYKLDHYTKVGYQTKNWGFGVLGIANASDAIKSSEFTVGPFINYSIKPLRKVPLTLLPEVSLLYSKSRYQNGVSTNRRLQELYFGHFSIGLDYELFNNWSLVYSLGAGYGREVLEYRNGSRQVSPRQLFSFPMFSSLGVEYTFNTKRE